MLINTGNPVEEDFACRFWNQAGLAQKAMLALVHPLGLWGLLRIQAAVKVPIDFLCPQTRQVLTWVTVFSGTLPVKNGSTYDSPLCGWLWGYLSKDRDLAQIFYGG